MNEEWSSFLGQCCDEGKSFLSEVPDSPAAKAYADIIDGMYMDVYF